MLLKILYKYIFISIIINKFDFFFILRNYMNLRELITGKSGDKQFLLGNEAAVRGVIEAGVNVAATYPGTPSSEIGDILSVIAKDSNIYFEFSANEKIAMEIAASAAASGLRSFTFMKHVGMNVASDSFITTAYTGIVGGMVILIADDPSIFSSQNEQDSRHYAHLANLLVLEPSSCQEVKDMVKYGFELSEQLKLPVIVRTTTRISHMRGIVELGEIEDNSTEDEVHWKKGMFIKNPSQFVPVPVNAQRMHIELIEKMQKARQISNNSDLNKEIKNKSNYGVISSSSAFNYAYDVIKLNNMDLSILKLGLSHPFPDKKVINFLKNLDEVFVLEEVDPIIEKELLAVIGQNKLNVTVYGKLDETFPKYHELNPDIVENGFNKILHLPKKEYKLNPDIEKLTNQTITRNPILCSGCPHRAIYYAVNKVLEKLKIPEKNVIFTSDIGCYTLGINPPYNTADYLLSMGSSVGDSCGFSIATNQLIFGFIGDSTFFHSGISPLLNAIHNKQKFVLTILDNRITAMTGGQPNPGIAIDSMGDEAPEISIRKIALACGVEFVRVVNPFNLEQVIKTYIEAIKHEKVAVIIAKSPCTLIKGLTKRPPVKLEYSNCTNCNHCIDQLACPSISTNDNKIIIDQSTCNGCNICVQVCKYGAIKPGEIK